MADYPNFATYPTATLPTAPMPVGRHFQVTMELEPTQTEPGLRIEIANALLSNLEQSHSGGHSYFDGTGTGLYTSTYTNSYANSWSGSWISNQSPVIAITLAAVQYTVTEIPAIGTQEKLVEEARQQQLKSQMELLGLPPEAIEAVLAAASEPEEDDELTETPETLETSYAD